MKGQLTTEQRLRQNVARLKTTNARLRGRVSELEALVLAQQKQLETQAIQIAELQTMVFGKKKRPPAGGTPIAVTLPKSPRTKDSYRRSIPPTETITQEVVQPLPETCTCGGSFDPVRTTMHARYEEDIPLPELTPGYQAYLVTRYWIERGRCLACGKVTSGKDLGGQTVRLGSNVRLLMTHLVAGVGMSYSQVANLILSLYGLVVSDGEIANVVQAQHQTWLPAYNQLQADIRAAPVKHYDETPWAIQAEQGAGYAWVMAAHASPNTLFHCATSRGAPHARKLHGNNTHNPDAVHISDDYQVYRTLPGSQQLCWVHLYRIIRDLRYNANLPEEQQVYVTWWYEQFTGIYQDLRLYLSEPFEPVTRDTQATELWQQIQTLARRSAPKEGEPDKLTRLKAQLLRAGKDRLFICLPKDTPCDNNRAERDLRQLVLKRKRSFGSKTERGATALATVLSICTTAWRSNPTGYSRALAQVG